VPLAEPNYIGNDASVSALGRRHDQPVLALQVHDREVVPLPVPDRTAAMQVEDKRHGFARFQIARIVEEECAIGLRQKGIPIVGDQFAGAVDVWTVDGRRRLTRYTGD
jgi:hypothetical protein